MKSLFHCIKKILFKLYLFYYLFIDLFIDTVSIYRIIINSISIIIIIIIIYRIISLFFENIMIIGII